MSKVDDNTSTSRGKATPLIPGWPGIGATGFQSALPQMGMPSLDAAIRVNTALVNTAVRMNNELVTFVGHRLTEEMALPGRLAANPSPDDTAKTYSEFIKTASEEYSAEIQKIASMMSEASAELPGLAATEKDVVDTDEA